MAAAPDATIAEEDARPGLLSMMYGNGGLQMELTEAGRRQRSHVAFVRGEFESVELCINFEANGDCCATANIEPTPSATVDADTVVTWTARMGAKGTGRGTSSLMARHLGGKGFGKGLAEAIQAGQQAAQQAAQQLAYNDLQMQLQRQQHDFEQRLRQQEEIHQDELRRRPERRDLEKKAPPPLPPSTLNTPPPQEVPAKAAPVKRTIPPPPTTPHPGSESMVIDEA